MWLKATLALLFVGTVADAMLFHSYYRTRIYNETAATLHRVGDLKWSGILTPK